MFNAYIPHQDGFTFKCRFHSKIILPSPGFEPMTFQFRSSRLPGISFSRINRLLVASTARGTFELSLKQLIWSPATSSTTCTSNRVGVQLLHLQPWTTRSTYIGENFLIRIDGVRVHSQWASISKKLYISVSFSPVAAVLEKKGKREKTGKKPIAQFTLRVLWQAQLTKKLKMHKQTDRQTK